MRYVLPLLFALCTGCSTVHYYGQALGGQLDVLAKREDAARLARRADTPDALRAQLVTALSIRRFAIEQLALPDNGSYLGYSALGRPYAVWSVTATPAFSLTPLQWCYPVIGCARYRGYFRESAARDLAAHLAANGHDVMVSGVPAYSTLGHFADPLTDTMLDGRDATRLAALLFHELAHQVAYAPNDSAFNEGFAVVVAGAGLERWLAAHDDRAGLEYLRMRRAAEARARVLLLDAHARLARFYAVHSDTEGLRTGKARILAAVSAEGRQIKGVAHWFTPPINNARLAALDTYQRQVPALERLLDVCGNDLPRFYAAARALARLAPDARRAALEGSAPVCAAA